MRIWVTQLKRMPAPNFILILLDVLLVLLVLILVSNNYVFIPGVQSATLPQMNTAEIMGVNKLIVTVTGEGHFIFNGQKKKSWQDLEMTLRQELDGARRAARHRNGGTLSSEMQPVIVLRGDQNMPYGTLLAFCDFARSVPVRVFLATEYGPRQGELPGGSEAGVRNP